MSNNALPEQWSKINSKVNFYLFDTDCDILYIFNPILNKFLKSAHKPQSTLLSWFCCFNCGVYMLSCWRYRLLNWLTLSAETRLPHLYTVSSWFTSCSTCDQVCSRRSQQDSLCFNKCIFHKCAHRQERVYGKRRQRETDRHLVFLNRGGMSLLWRTLWLHDMHEHITEHWIIRDRKVESTV